MAHMFRGFIPCPAISKVEIYLKVHQNKAAWFMVTGSRTGEQFQGGRGQGLQLQYPRLYLQDHPDLLRSMCFSNFLGSSQAKEVNSIMINYHNHFSTAKRENIS